MYRIAFILNLLITFGFTTLSGNQQTPVPEHGILDLRNRIVDSQSIIKLDGEWIFHWEELLTPGTLDAHVLPGIPVMVPSYWNSYKIQGKPLPGWGYGTYQLTVLLPDNFQSAICFDIPIFDVAYRFYLNERLVSENGVVGTSMDEEEPWYDPSSFCLVPDTDTLQILIQVSNFHHRRGGFWQPMFMGGTSKILDRKERRRFYEYSTIGVLFFFMVFFLIFWFLSRRESMMLLFALTIMGILMRTVNTGLYFSNIFVNTPWVWQVRMEYLGSFLAQLFGFIFLHRLFPKSYMKQIVRINTGLMTLASISLFFLPVHLFAYEMLIYQPLLLLVLSHYLIISFLGTLKGRVVDAVFFVSLSFFLITLVNDILVANSAGSVSSNYFSQFSFQVFILAMAVMIIIQWIQNNRERLQLQSSLQFKNRVLSVVAHDLKNPIASVAQFSDLLASKPSLTSKTKLIQALQESAQAALNLLDNLLYWGRNETNELHISPKKILMESLIQEVASLYHHMAIQKEVELTTDVEKGISALADPVFIHIVLRNLVGNAIKFTRRNGSVHIRSWQEGQLIYCSVIDTGVGMKPEHLEQFRNDGFMTSTPGTDQEIGTGLGLQLVKDLLEKNHGTLEIQSKTGEGSTFTFTLPLAKQYGDEDIKSEAEED
jgi:signal transduction histidine kinase